MSLLKCNECGGHVSSEAKACPACGKPIKRTSFIAKFFMGFVLFMVLIQVLAEQKSSETKTEQSRKIAAMSVTEKNAFDKEQSERKKREDLESEQSAAPYACRQFVMESLHDPDGSNLDRANRYPSKRRKDGSYLVQVTGRAKNGFGALRKISVNCSVRKSGDNWLLVNLKEINAN